MKSSMLSFVPRTKFQVHGRDVEVDSVDAKKGTVILKAPAPSKETLSYGLAELNAMYFRGELTLPPGAEPRHEPTWKATLKELTKEQRKRVARRIAYTNACAPLYPVGPLSRRLSTAIAEVAQRIGDRMPPSPHSVYRWMRRYILSNYNTAVFVQDAAAIRKRKPRIDKGVRDLLAVEIERLLGANKKATLNGVMDEALASVAKRLGYINFIAKDGTEQASDEFLALLEQERAQAAEENEEDDDKTEDRRAAA
jgi:hypothetical protein